MKKVCLLVQDNNVKESFIKLRELGAVHLEKKHALTDTHSIALEKKNKIDGAMGLIHHLKVPKPPKQPKFQSEAAARERRAPVTGVRRGRRSTDIYGTEGSEFYSLNAVRAPERPSLANMMMEVGHERKTLQDRAAFLFKEISRITPWGEFNPESVKNLSSLDVPVFLYEISHEAFNKIGDDVLYTKLDSDKIAVRLFVYYKEIPGILPFALPEKSLSELKNEVTETNSRLKVIEDKIKSYANRRPNLLKEMDSVVQEIEFENATAALEKAEIDNVSSDYKFSYVMGYIPNEDMEKLKKTASDNYWALIADDPGDDEMVPTKLKNNKFTQLLYPLLEFLDMTPGYKEVDISPFFLMFFSVFFAMIFGDAVYGLILFALAIFGIIKTYKKGVPGILKLLVLLSVANIIWGVLTCSWLGLDYDSLPQIFRDMSLSYISTAKGTKLVNVNQNMQVLCFTIALLQLTIGRIISIKKNIHSLKVLADFGQLGMLWGMYNVVLFLVASSKSAIVFPLLPVSIYLLAAGFVLSFVFAEYQGSILKSILESCKNIISVVLSITNVFSDIMSYIRLWAVGLAGASIAATVNGMAGGTLGSFLVFLGLILMLFGHGLNLTLNTLSVLVHGVRLNTLEFSSHAGIIWSGTAYRPFAVKNRK